MTGLEHRSAVLVDTDVNVSIVGGMSTAALAPPTSSISLDPDTGSVISGATVATGGDPASTLDGTVAHGMGLLVAPAIGRFRAVVADGPVESGALVGVVTGGGGRSDEVRVPVQAEVCGLLALEGQLVQSGQALAWIRRIEP